MDDWKSLLYRIANHSETSFDRFKLRFRQRMGWTTNVQVLPYMTYGTSVQVLIKGRVLHDRGIEVSDRDRIWNNLLNMYKRFSSYEIAGARLKVTFNHTETTLTSDEDGYFESTITFDQPLPPEELWHHPLIELLDSPVRSDRPVQVRSRVMTPPSTARFGVISDIDDTIIPTHAKSLLKSAYTTFLNSAHTRLPFEGVAAFYRALGEGLSGAEMNPLFYVSSSPWNLYDLLTDFMEVNGIPRGPLLLKDYGFTHNKIFSESHGDHKTRAIKHIMDTYPHLPFILIGDSGQHDPEIYSTIARLFPGRVLSIYIRDVSNDKRDTRVKALSAGLADTTDLILSEDSFQAAKHAAEKGFINPARLSMIEEEKMLDKNGEDLY